MAKLSHFDDKGGARMVDVSDKEETNRIAKAWGQVLMLPETLRLIKQRKLEKGDVLQIARLAGILACKKTGELIPLCHPLPVTSIDLELSCDENTSSVVITATVQTISRTGVEMEALTAVSIAGLTIYDMCKSIDRRMVIDGIKLIHKSGGKSGVFDISGGVI